MKQSTAPQKKGVISRVLRRPWRRYSSLKYLKYYCVGVPSHGRLFLRNMALNLGDAVLSGQKTMWHVMLAIALLATACSSKKENATGDAAVSSTQSDLQSTYNDQSVNDGTNGLCGAMVYPCGPYGTEAGDIAENMEFLGFADPNYNCKAHKDKAMDLQHKVRITFADWYRDSSEPTCKSFNKELLWVMVVAGWCGPCQGEVDAVENMYIKGQIDERVEVLNIIFENANRGEPIDETFTLQWIGIFNLTFPVVMDPSFKMGKYFDKRATPFNMLVDTKTGKIIHRQVGPDINTMQAKIAAFLKK